MSSYFDRLAGFKQTKKFVAGDIDAALESLRSTLEKDVEGFEDKREAARSERVERAERDLDYFARTYFPHYCRSDRSEMMAEIDALYERSQARMVWGTYRGAAKTARYTVIANVWHCLFPAKLPAPFIVIGTADEILAKGYTGSIQVELESNTRLLQDFGSQKGKGSSKKWQEGNFTTAKGVHVLARGMGQRVRGLFKGGWRPGLIDLDDIEDNDLVRSPDQIEKTILWIEQECIPALEVGGHFHFKGNYFGEGTVLDHFRNKPDWWFWKLYPLRGKDGRSTWPSRYPDADVTKLEAELGSDNFEKEYQCNPVTKTSIFRAAWLKPWIERPDLAQLRLFAFADASAKGGEENDFKAFITLGAAQSGRMYVLDAFIRHCSMWEFLRAIVERYIVWHQVTIGFETNCFQSLILEMLPVIEKEYGIMLPTRGIDNTTNKILRISEMAAPMERGVFEFKPWAEPADEDMKELIKQIKFFGRKNVNDDGPDAMHGAWRLAKEFLAARGGAVKSAKKRESHRWSAQY